MCVRIKTFSHTIFSHHKLSFNTQDHNDRHIQQASPFWQYQMRLGIQLYLNCRPLACDSHTKPTHRKVIERYIDHHQY